MKMKHNTVINITIDTVVITTTVYNTYLYQIVIDNTNVWYMRIQNFLKSYLVSNANLSSISALSCMIS